jgi:hypothetical protein
VYFLLELSFLGFCFFRYTCIRYVLTSRLISSSLILCHAPMIIYLLFILILAYLPYDFNRSSGVPVAPLHFLLGFATKSSCNITPLAVATGEKSYLMASWRFPQTVTMVCASWVPCSPVRLPASVAITDGSPSGFLF